MTWKQFSKAFLRMYMTCSMRERLCDKFINLQQGFMSFSKYDMRFHELAKHASMIMCTKHERVFKFIRGLTFTTPFGIK